MSDAPKRAGAASGYGLLAQAASICATNKLNAVLRLSSLAQFPLATLRYALVKQLDPKLLNHR